jgi:hypothetical protein
VVLSAARFFYFLNLGLLLLEEPTVLSSILLSSYQRD